MTFFQLDLKKRIKEGKELTINDVYTVNLIGSQIHKLDCKLENVFFKRVWNLGIGYLDVPVKTSPNNLIGSNPFVRWLRSLEVLKPYPSWKSYVEEILSGSGTIKLKTAFGILVRYHQPIIH